MRHMLWYLGATSDHVLFYEAGVPLELYGYKYVDWAGSISYR